MRKNVVAAAAAAAFDRWLRRRRRREARNRDGSVIYRILVANTICKLVDAVFPAIADRSTSSVGLKVMMMMMMMMPPRPSNDRWKLLFQHGGFDLEL